MSTTPATRPTVDLIAESLRDYARKLIEAGFTVYVDAHPRIRHDGTPLPLGFFHYSREIDGQTCYGTVNESDFPLLGQPFTHSMPLTPSRLNGSGATVGARWGDPDTLGFDALAPDSVEYARIVARPANWCPYNAEPTREAIERANRQTGVPQRYYRGATLRNATPWGIGTHYVPAEAVTA